MLLLLLHDAYLRLSTSRLNNNPFNRLEPGAFNDTHGITTL